MESRGQGRTGHGSPESTFIISSHPPIEGLAHHPQNPPSHDVHGNPCLRGAGGEQQTTVSQGKPPDHAQTLKLLLWRGGTPSHRARHRTNSGPLWLLGPRLGSRHSKKFTRLQGGRSFPPLPYAINTCSAGLARGLCVQCTRGTNHFGGCYRVSLASTKCAMCTWRTGPCSDASEDADDTVVIPSGAATETRESPIVILSHNASSQSETIAADVAAVDAVSSREGTAEAAKSITSGVAVDSSRPNEMVGSPVGPTAPPSNSEETDAAVSQDEFDTFAQGLEPHLRGLRRVALALCFAWERHIGVRPDPLSGGEHRCVFSTPSRMLIQPSRDFQRRILTFTGRQLISLSYWRGSMS
jgi:hypothetical protein